MLSSRAHNVICLLLVIGGLGLGAFVATAPGRPVPIVQLHIAAFIAAVLVGAVVLLTLSARAARRQRIRRRIKWK